ncbi:unnamed protein product [Bursaphelenchus xylophilus]|uniref:glutathione transferase n=1 Tax=Bursaphelenchus xylophilus TaxID=6326 RepID=A0A1I7RQK6_BURXY|nr:unnamed protein product [Bursaphelenchus xylophilus]CAG9104743.1 unnamed protein product [Bursaphelenchus xylophilus]
MPQYELVYFEFRGRAEAIRLALNYAKIPFTDTRLTRQEFEKIKGEKNRFPYGQVPVLFFDGKRIAQSHSIIRYLAAEAGLAGRDRVEAAEIDEIYETCRELFDALTPYLRTYIGRIPGDIKALYKDLLVPTVDKYLPIIQDFIGQNGFFHQSGISYADFYFVNYFDIFNRMHPEVFKRFGKLLEHTQRIYALPELQDYLAKRRDHTF